MIRVVIADDQPLVLDGFEAVLNSADDIDVVGKARDGEEALGLVGELGPDIVILDVRMPGMDGLEAAERILSAPDPGARVIMLTTFDLDEYVYRALSLGASGFMVKQATAAEFTQAVRTVAGGESMLSPSVTTRLISAFSSRGGVPFNPDSVRNLSDREKDVLSLLGEGMSNNDISGELHISMDTVKTHVKSLLSKLGLRDRAQAAVYYYKNGLDGGAQKP
ncbi:MAG TPA: response regulator transcription factor [Candidatus Corynebacterium avicola]|uniref:Response regulator transcription factor n=1 Tax=Candidatus Corynebacterium avicola TaxID=2838527 RepID=A0A9D1UKQ4_9CORY|nr:response regulator transcription factor [Candidatus Corynebacterium avicola]